MAINTRELKTVARKISTKREVHVTEALLLSLAEKILEAYEKGVEFEDALRASMDELNLKRKSKTRSVYREIMGSYFGKHGRLKAARNRELGKPHQAQVAVINQIIAARESKAKVDKHGQLYLRLE